MIKMKAIAMQGEMDGDFEAGAEFEVNEERAMYLERVGKAIPANRAPVVAVETDEPRFGVLRKPE